MKKRMTVMVLVLMLGGACFYNFHVRSQIPYFDLMRSYYPDKLIFNDRNYLFDGQKLHYYGYLASAHIYSDENDYEAIAYVNMIATDSYWSDYEHERDDLRNDVDYFKTGTEDINGYQIEYWMNDEEYIGFFRLGDACFRIRIDNVGVPQSEFRDFTTETLYKSLKLK